MTIDYKSTLYLPKTAFKMKANLAQREPEILKRWEDMDIYARQRKDSKGREKFIEELNETHELFKEYVSKRRPNVDINKIASGEIWFGSRAKELSLVDEISTSDEYICSCFNSAKVFEIKFVRKQKLLQRVGGSVEASITRIAEKLWSRFTNPNNNF